MFDHVAVWFAKGPDILLMGLNSPDGYPDLDTIVARAERPDLKAGLARCGARTVPEVLAHELIPPGFATKEKVAGELHTLRRPILSQHAARAFFAGRRVELPRFAGGPDADGARPTALLAQLLGTGRIPEEIESNVTRHVCESQRVMECVTWLARWRTDHPESREARLYDPRSIDSMAQVDVLSPQTIARVEQMFRGVIPPERAQTNPVARAALLTNLFSTFYVHAIPFDRAVLRNAWSECGRGGDLASTCHTARVHADGRLDRFELPRADNPGS